MVAWLTKFWAFFTNPISICIAVILKIYYFIGLQSIVCFFCRLLICHSLCTPHLWLRLVMVLIRFVCVIRLPYHVASPISFWLFVLSYWIVLLSVLLQPLPLLYYYFLGSSSIYFLISCCYLFALQQTIWLFFRDMVKGICLAVILGPPIVSAIIVIVQVKPYICEHLFICSA